MKINADFMFTIKDSTAQASLLIDFHIKEKLMETNGFKINQKMKNTAAWFAEY